MEGNKITIAILVTTFIPIIFICLTTSISASPNYSLSPPTKADLTKSFFWDVSGLGWPDGVYPLCNVPIEVYYLNCTTQWVYLYTKTTDKNGMIDDLDLIPGEYKFKWIGEGECCRACWTHKVTCDWQSGDAFPDNYVRKVKGGDKAFPFFPRAEQSSNSWFSLITTYLNRLS